MLIRAALIAAGIALAVTSHASADTYYYGIDVSGKTSCGTISPALARAERQQVDDALAVPDAGQRVSSAYWIQESDTYLPSHTQSVAIYNQAVVEQQQAQAAYRQSKVITAIARENAEQSCAKR